MLLVYGAIIELTVWVFYQQKRVAGQRFAAPLPAFPVAHMNLSLQKLPHHCVTIKLSTVHFKLPAFVIVM